MTWIPLKTRQPSDGMHLVYAPSADPAKPMIVTAWWNERLKRWDLLIKYWSDAVTHWMPLPNPPRRTKEAK